MMRILKTKEKKAVATIMTIGALMGMAVFVLPKPLTVYASESVADEEDVEEAPAEDVTEAQETEQETAGDATDAKVPDSKIGEDTAAQNPSAAESESEPQSTEPVTTTVNPGGELKTTLVEDQKGGGYTPKSTGNTLMTVVRQTDVLNAPGDDGVVLYTYKAGDAVVVCGQQTKGCMPVIFRGQIAYVDSANLSSAYIDYKQLAREIEFVNENSITQPEQEENLTDSASTSHVWMIILIVVVIILGAVGVASAVYAIRKL